MVPTPKEYTEHAQKWGVQGHLSERTQEMQSRRNNWHPLASTPWPEQLDTHVLLTGRYYTEQVKPKRQGDQNQFSSHISFPFRKFLHWTSVLALKFGLLIPHNAFFHLSPLTPCSTPFSPAQNTTFPLLPSVNFSHTQPLLFMFHPSAAPLLEALLNGFSGRRFTAPVTENITYLPSYKATEAVHAHILWE